MSKIVLEANVSELTNGDVLVYDATRKCFVNIKKVTFLSNRTQRENQLEKEINKLKLELEAQKQKFQELIKIVKENVK